MRAVERRSPMRGAQREETPWILPATLESWRSWAITTLLFASH